MFGWNSRRSNLNLVSVAMLVYLCNIANLNICRGGGKLKATPQRCISGAMLVYLILLRTFCSLTPGATTAPTWKWERRQRCHVVFETSLIGVHALCCGIVGTSLICILLSAPFVLRLVDTLYVCMMSCQVLNISSLKPVVKFYILMCNMT